VFTAAEKAAAETASSS